ITGPRRAHRHRSYAIASRSLAFSFAIAEPIAGLLFRDRRADRWPLFRSRAQGGPTATVLTRSRADRWPSLSRSPSRSLAFSFAIAEPIAGLSFDHGPKAGPPPPFLRDREPIAGLLFRDRRSDPWPSPSRSPSRSLASLSITGPRRAHRHRSYAIASRSLAFSFAIADPIPGLLLR